MIISSRFFLIASALALPLSAFADSRYSVFKVQDDEHVIRTSDGASTGRVEYIVVEPSTRRVVSTVVTGGAVGEKFVMIPFQAARFDGSRDITLTDVDRENVLSAPPIDPGRLQTSKVMKGSEVDAAFEHYGLQRDGVPPEPALVRSSAPSEDVTPDRKESKAARYASRTGKSRTSRED